MKKDAVAKALALVVLSVAGLESHAYASPIVYDFNWISEGNLPLPTSGSFTYDSAAAVGSQFSDFVVDWDGFSFNFTANANSATVSSTCGAVTSPQIFQFLTGTPECTPTPNTFSWIGNAGGPSPTFNIFDTSGLGTTDIELGASSGTQVTGSPAPVSGLYSVSTASTPEPSMFIVLLAGCAFLVLKRARANRKLAHAVQ
jgi:hypothetical protein